MGEASVDDHRSELGTIIRAYCSSCGGDRNCEVRGHHRQAGGDDEGYHSWHTDWYILTCRGCDHVFAQSVSTDSEDYELGYDSRGDEMIEYNERIETWPARSKRDIPDWFSHQIVETDIKNANALNASLRELYGALDADLMVLASIAIRTSFDIAAELLGVDPALSFPEKMESLVNKGHIVEADKASIEILIDAGSASAHRGWRPSLADVDALTTALEDFIHASMVFPAKKRVKAAKMAEIKGRVPKRQRRKKAEVAADHSTAAETDGAAAEPLSEHGS